MDTLDRDRVRAWLVAESSGREDAADGALAELMAGVPRLEPSRRFVGAVMAQIRESAEAPSTVWANWWVRGALASSLTLLGAVAGTASWQAVFDAIVATARNVGWSADRIATGFHAWVDVAGAFWTAVAHAATVLARLLVAPGPAMLLMFNLVLAAGALAALQRLLVTQEKR